MASVPRIFESTSSVKMSATKPMALCARESQAVGRDNPRRFLPAMLQRMQPQVSQLLRLGMGEDRHHAALVVKFVGRIAFQLLAFSFSSTQS